MKQGVFIVIEGTDGSGKTEQTKRLVERLAKEGHAILSFDFPRYGNPSAYFVEKYLNGQYGTSEEVGARRGSLFFALDRFDAGKEIQKALNGGMVVVSNRYVASNMAHQGGKIADEKEREKFFNWEVDLEFELLGIPRPDLNVVLHVPAAIAQSMVDKKGHRDYVGGAKRDIHEADIEHLRRAEETYIEIVRLYPDRFSLVECAPGGKLLSLEAVHEKVWTLVSALLGKFSS
ncbi:MAG: hypothetical protein A3B25_02810 [Candidatus Ryanbacteria bacterium RIFCSPLOWO2_01_FULL_48_26]|uniref:Thymidylate kinase n=1 Tax=Candidatus Ryanbacteria bacterium RIFCSPLOWO2_01_FULL_48_26 TaxID=1802126 RepID=A0A1G2GXQ7_9BACT|nr:MAG: hypothetical protein A3B25_02810 [Candidatus Ryanbacteria bacterium RIFCSPLOWO2_01_FULL_48_26]